MLWIGILPAFLVLFIMKGVKESPVWLERQRHLKEHKRARLAVAGAALQARSAVDDAAHVAPDGRVPVHVPLDHLLVSDAAHADAPPDAAVSRGAERRRHRRRASSCGRMSEGRLGPPRRGDDRDARRHPGRCRCTCSRTTRRCCGSARSTMGFFGAGNFGVVPGYLTERFPTVARAVGAGFAYHVGAGPRIVHADAGRDAAGPRPRRCRPRWPPASPGPARDGHPDAMWLGPETRGRQFHATD